jgi:hypothetical protein
VKPALGEFAFIVGEMDYTKGREHPMVIEGFWGR